MKKKLLKNSFRQSIGNFMTVFVMTLLTVSGVFAENSTQAPASLSIKIKNPDIGNWSAQKTFTSKYDLLIRIEGIVCGKKGGSLTKIFKPVLTGVETSVDFTSYSAKAINDGNGYVLVKNFSGWENSGIREVWFVNYERNAGCYVEKELHFKNQIDPYWFVGGCEEDGCSGGLYVSMDRTLIMKIGIGQYQVLNDQGGKKMKPVRQVSNVPFSIYSMRTLEKLDSGRSVGVVKTKRVAGENHLMVRGVEYELFLNWAAKKDSPKRESVN